MQIGKLNVTEWRWNGRKLANPFLIVWKLIWVIPVYCALGLLALLIAVFNLDIEMGIDVFNNNR